MGYFVQYSLKLAIRPRHYKRALEIFNHLHSDEMLLEHARGRVYGYENKPIRERHWYSWVNNPVDPYKTLSEAFNNWAIVDNYRYYIDNETKDFIVEGSYHDKLGQQEFLIEQLAPVLRNTAIEVSGEDGDCWRWVIENHQFRKEEFPPLSQDPPSDDDADEIDQKQLERLAGLDGNIYYSSDEEEED